MSLLRFHLRQAIRGLRKSPGYVAAFVLTFGLAVGVNSAVFSVVHGVLLRPLPFQDAERILFLKQQITAAGVENTNFSFIEIDDLRAASSTIDEFVEFGDWDFTVVGEDEPRRAVGGLVTSNYFGVLGMRPALGRLLNEEDDVQGAEPVMLLTDAYWERAFGRDPGVVGRILDLDGVATRVVGVLEPGMHYTGSRQQDFYVNYATNAHYQGAAMRDARNHRMTDVFARLAPGSTVEAARGELRAIAARLHREYPETYRPELGYAVEAVPWQAELTREGRSTFLFLMATVGVVLLLAAANVANLTLTRLIRKESELSTRAALGATGTDLRLHLTAENALLGLAGGSLGVVLALVSRDSLVAYAGRFTVRAQEVGVDWTVLGVTLGGGMLVAALLAWLPGLPVDPGVGRVASAGSRTTETRVRRQLQRGLVVGQLALSFTLLTGAGLLVRSLVELSAVDPGFRTERILTLETPGGPFGTAAGDGPILERAWNEIRALPGVRSAAVASWVPLSGETPVAFSVRIDGSQDEGDRSFRSAVNNVSPGYFETLGIPLVSGRYFEATDREESAPVVIVNRSMARAHFGDADPIGRRLSFSLNGQSWMGEYEIVGVVADTREYGIGIEGIHTLYRPAAQASWGPAMLVASDLVAGSAASAGEASAGYGSTSASSPDAIAWGGDAAVLVRQIRDVIHGVQPDRAVDRVQTLAALRDRDVAPSRLNAVLFGSFAALALAIAALGVLGALAFSVSRRAREFGIRMALGADRSSILGDVLGEGVLLLGVALLAGGAAAFVLAGSLSGLLYQVAPIDPVSMIVAAAVLCGVAVGAALVPAVRATRVDPAEALKGE